MKKLVFLILISLCYFACSNSAEPTSASSNDVEKVAATPVSESKSNATDKDWRIEGNKFYLTRTKAKMSHMLPSIFLKSAPEEKKAMGSQKYIFKDEASEMEITLSEEPMINYDHADVNMTSKIQSNLCKDKEEFKSDQALSTMIGSGFTIEKYRKKVGEHYACVIIALANNQGKEYYTASLLAPFYSLECRGLAAQKEELLSIMESFEITYDKSLYK